MGIGKVNQSKVVPFVEGPLGGRKIFSIHLCGKNIEALYGFYKFNGKAPALSSIASQEESQEVYPKGNKGKVGPYTFGDKGNFFIQGMIRLGYGDEFGKQYRVILKKKEIPEYGNNTA
jgi:hypothetical protein